MTTPTLPQGLRLAAIVAALGVVGLGTSCRKSADEERRQAERATAEAEEKAQEATLTSATIETKEEAETARDDAERAKAESIRAFRAEQNDYRARLQKALDDLDDQVLEARKAGRRDERVRQARARRELLKKDLDLLERSTEQTWATTRTTIDRHLKDRREAGEDSR